MSYDEKFQGLDKVGRTDENYELKCGHCGNSVGAIEVAFYQNTRADLTAWVVCPICSHGSVIDRNGKTYPSHTYGDIIQGLPVVVKAAYDEARDCMSIGAFTGCELVCRKILMHIAVDKCGGKEGGSFKSYIELIEKIGYITPPMKGWVKHIKDRGNDATHKLKTPSKGESENTMNFTIQLLRLVYEMDYLSEQYNKPKK